MAAPRAQCIKLNSVNTLYGASNGFASAMSCRCGLKGRLFQPRPQAWVGCPPVIPTLKGSFNLPS